WSSSDLTGPRGSSPRGTTHNIGRRRAYPVLPGSGVESFLWNRSSPLPNHTRREAGRPLQFERACGSRRHRKERRHREQPLPSCGFSSPCPLLGSQGSDVDGGLLRLDSCAQRHEVGGQRQNLFVCEVSARFNGIRNQRLRISEPGFDPSGRQPASGITQVGTHVSARAADRVAGLALIFHLIELLAKRGHRRRDRKSTRLNSSHVAISYAVFCLKKKKNAGIHTRQSVTIHRQAQHPTKRINFERF